METKWIFLGAIVAIGIVLVVLVLSYFGIYNGLITAEQKVEGQWSLVEVQYQRRIDLIPNIIAVVNKEANFEQTTLTKLTELRSQWQNASNLQQKLETANEIESTISKLLVITENYPTLQATQAYQDLMVELEGTENRVAFARGEFNNSVKEYNTMIKVVPNNIVAGMSGLVAKEYFVAESGAENAPNVSETLQ